MIAMNRACGTPVAEADGRTWSEAHRYSIVLRLGDKQCIAPTKEGRRCMLPASSDVKALDSRILELERPEDIVTNMLNLVLVRCCVKHHKDRLEARPLCRRAVAEAYIERYAEKNLLRVTVPRNLDVSFESIAVGQLQPYVPPKQIALSALMGEALITSEGEAMKEDGVVYGFTSPAWPDVVKIGYSGISAQSRMDRLAKCMPRSEIVVEQSFLYPERMEQLIHLELNSERRRVIRCRGCGGEHKEFFELPAEEIEVLVEEWRWVAETAPLYDTKTGKLTQRWQKRLEALKVEATAFELKKLLQLEKMEEMRAKLEVLKVKIENFAASAAKQPMHKLTNAAVEHGQLDDTFAKLELTEGSPVAPSPRRRTGTKEPGRHSKSQQAPDPIPQARVNSEQRNTLSTAEAPSNASVARSLPGGDPQERKKHSLPILTRKAVAIKVEC